MVQSQPVILVGDGVLQKFVNGPASTEAEKAKVDCFQVGTLGLCTALPALLATTMIVRKPINTL